MFVCLLWLVCCCCFFIVFFVFVMLLLGIWGILFFFLFDYGMAIVVLEDDCYDGNIFVVYVGNGFLVLFCLNLREFFECKLLVILVYYFDDSKDCK